MSEQLQRRDTGIKSLMANDMVKSKFTEILGKNASSFISSVVTLATTTALAECEPKSILSASIAAASLGLNVNPNLGQAALVPYNNKGGKAAQFQIMARGFVQLALRSGQFSLINVTEIYEGEFLNENRLTGELDFTGKRTSNKIVGYAAYFRLLNGFAKALYMKVEDINAHGKKYSKSYSYSTSAWQTNFDGMARKTVLKLLLSRFAPLSTEMQMAVQQDQAVITTDENMEFTDLIYEDNPATDEAKQIEPMPVDVKIERVNQAAPKGRDWKKTEVEPTAPSVETITF